VAQLAETTVRRTLTYAIDRDADVRASNVRQQGAQMHFDLHLPDRAAPLAVALNAPGRHNVQNALAAAAVGWQLGIEADAIARALAAFQGVGRRFQFRGELALDQGTALLVDDYGHHPRELAAVFAAARGGWPQRRLVVAFQPHRYTRTRDLLDDFANVLADVDVLVLTDVYPAGEAPIAGADGRALARAVRARGKVDPVLVEHPRDLKTALPALLADGDLLLLMGAGDIGAAAIELAAAGQLKSDKVN
jgi:UDP-N-acetylmuramate--alanine ligase